ncbi:putative RNA recognition motif domain, nucleotide-binding alpha-beta plait domain superfamily [Helianthus annuus]|nr:putative RNA recognition motif domain, nucleotide-binding alpha-beta plait domain superfamily [Helianthus annuus]
MASRDEWGGGEDDNGGPWADVQYRKNRKSKGNGVEWTFLVQNISDRVTKSVLWRSFQPFGFISDAYVARKRDTRGRCFGFIRFMGVEDIKGFLATLNSVRMFDMKVVVSLAKYDKDHNRISYAPNLLGRNVWKPKATNQGNINHSEGANNNAQFYAEKQPPESGPSGPSFVQDGRSFADLLKGNADVHGQGTKVITVEGKGSLYPIHCVGRSVIGCTKEIMSISKVKMIMEENGLSEVGFSYVGGMIFLLTFKDKTVAMARMESHASFFKDNFSEHKLWKGEDIPYSRVAQLNIAGVPFIIRDNSLFDRIGSLFGKVIQPSSFSWQNEDNSVCSVMVLTNRTSRIEEAVIMKWNNKSLIAWVSEVPGISMQNLGYDESMSDSDSDFDTQSSSESDEDLVDVEDMEEGEIRRNVSPVVLKRLVDKIRQQRSLVICQGKPLSLRWSMNRPR